MVQDNQKLSFLDLGCGTGLLAKALYAQLPITYAVGVDISQAMLLQAKAKGVYNHLHRMDIIEYLRDSEEYYDIIGGTDVFPYFGDLQEVFKLIYAKINKGGVFGYCVEHLKGAGFKLNDRGRYQHSDQYMQHLIASCGFKLRKSQLIDLRLELGEAVVE